METGRAYDACGHRFPLSAKIVLANDVLQIAALEIDVLGTVALLPRFVAAALAMAVLVAGAFAQGVLLVYVLVTDVPEKGVNVDL